MHFLACKVLLRRCKRLQSVAASMQSKTLQKKLRPVIGLEIHTQLLTQSKMFSDAPVTSHAASNTNVSLFDMGTPGTLPTLNQRCVELSIRTAILLNCEIARECRFDRKHYFYPDMPTGYQITQHELPIAKNGYLEYLMPSGNDGGSPGVDRRRIRIKQLQMEMDSGKIVYGTNRNLVDLNRAGVGLVEIVTEPDLSSPAEAAFFVEHLRLMLIHNRICQGEMHHGQLRIDANVSISADGQEGVRTETKNINSFRDLQNCLEFEVNRQMELISRGEEVQPETRAAANGRTVLMRVKNNDLDYRFLPEPNLPRLRLKVEMIEQERKQVDLDAPHLIYINKHQLPVDFALNTVSDAKMRVFVDKCLKQLKLVSSQNVVEMLRELRQVFQAIKAPFPPENDKIVDACCSLINLNAKRKITHLAYLDLIRLYAMPTNADVAGVDEKITELNFWAINDEAEVLRVVDETIATTPANLVEKAKTRPQSKHFNKLRNMVVNRVNKRIHIDDAEKLVLQRLNEEAN